MSIVLFVFIVYIKPIIKGKTFILINASDSGKGFRLTNS
jgi:hypothetical protein